MAGPDDEQVEATIFLWGARYALSRSGRMAAAHERTGSTT
jgi:hypothetical protein